MITLSANLQTAAAAQSRSPLVKATIEDVSISLTALAGVSISDTVVHLQEGNGYWIATAYSSTVVKANRITDLSSAADWNATWTTIATVTSGWAKHHHLLVDSDDVLILYSDDSGVLKARESDDGGQTWGSAYTVYTFTGYNYTAKAVAVDLNTAFVLVQDFTAGDLKNNIARVTRTHPSTTWSLDEYSDYGDACMVWDVSATQDLIAADLGTEIVLLARAVQGDVSYADSEIRSVFEFHYQNGSWGAGKPWLGSSGTYWDYYYQCVGPATSINGYWFIGILESIKDAADEDGYTTKSTTYIARTTDFKAFHMVQLSSGSGPVAFANDGSNIYIPINSVVYYTPASSWFGETPTETDFTSDLLADLSISRNVRTAAKTSLKISNIGGQYDANSLLEGGAVVRIDGGYKTASGDEYQQRMIGQVYPVRKTTGHQKDFDLDIYDFLSRMSTGKVFRPHIIKGQNVFNASFALPTDADFFVAQAGVWASRIADDSTVRYVAETMDTETGLAMSIAGFEATDSKAVIVDIKSMNIISNVKFGIIIHHSIGNYSTVGWNYVEIVRYNKTTSKIEYVVIRLPHGDETVIAQSSSSYSWANDTKYWLMATMKHGSLECYYSTDGSTFISALSTERDYQYNVASALGYVGVYADIPDASSAQVSFDNFKACSLLQPKSASWYVDYLAQMYGIDTDEQTEITDGFAASPFSSRWDTPGVDGTWTISGGKARGTMSASDDALLKTDISATDIIVKCTVTVQTGGSGVFVRGDDALENCYSAIVTTAAVIIRKKESDSWTSLIIVPASFTGDVEMVFMARGPYLSVFIDGVLGAFAYDTSLSDAGYVGITTRQTGTASYHDDFQVDGFYKPTDVVVLRPNDNPITVLSQLADMHENGEFFINEDGELKWGIFDSTTTNLDVRNTGSPTLDMQINKSYDKVLTMVRVVGNNAYAEDGSLAWGRKLLSVRYEQTQSNVLTTKEACLDAANKLLDESQRIEEESISIKGHPGLELCDVILTAEDDGDSGNQRRVLSFSETIGFVYDMNIDTSESLSGEAA